MESNALLQNFTSWLNKSGATLSDDVVVAVDNAQRPLSYPGWSIYTKTAFTEQQLICRLPKHCVLSTRTTVVANVLASTGLDELEGVGITVALMMETARGDASRFAPYIRSLPKREYVPMFWTDDELRMLKGTEAAESPPRSDVAITTADWNNRVLPVLTQLVEAAGLDAEAAAGLTLDAYRNAASLVASRSFAVDEFHGDSMVPVADIFNHKASVVDVEGPWEAFQHKLADGSDGDEPEGEDEEESEEGEEEGEGQRDGEGEDEGSGEHGAVAGGRGEGAGQEEGKEEEGGGDIGDDSESDGEEASSSGDEGVQIAPRRKDPRLVADSSLALEMAICSNDDVVLEGDLGKEFPGVLDIVAARDIEAGREIHNTYGEHGNAILLRKYAFCLRVNPFTEVMLDASRVETLAMEAFVGSGQKAARSKAWARLKEWLGTYTAFFETDDDGDELEPFVVYAGGYVNESLALFLYAASRATEVTGWDDAGSLIQGLSSSMPEGSWVCGDRIVPVRDLAAALGADMSGVMRAACEERDAAYGKAFEEDVRALEGVQEKASSSQGEIGDGVVAALGAAMLRVSEREALRSVMEACCSDGEDKRGGGERKRKREEDGNGEA